MTQNCRTLRRVGKTFRILDLEMNMTSKTQTFKAKVDKWDIIKLEEI